LADLPGVIGRLGYEEAPADLVDSVLESR